MKRKGISSRKALLILIIFVIAYYIFSFVLDLKEISQNQFGVIVNRDGSFKLIQSGQKPLYIPFLQKLYLISLKPMTIELTRAEAVRVFTKDKKELFVESQITYVISDIKLVVKNFGYKEPHLQIRKEIKEVLSNILKKDFSEVLSNDTKGRIFLIAEVHNSLNEEMNKRGVEVKSFRIRFR